MATLPLQTVTSEIKHNEEVVIYPTFGYWDQGHQTWRITVWGSVHGTGPDTLRKRVLMRILQRLLKAPPDQLSRDVFRRRLAGFLVVTQRGKAIVVRIGQRSELLPRRSRRNGHFRGNLLLSTKEVGHLQNTGSLRDGWLDLRVVPPEDDDREFSGRVQLISEAGLSVISDIDDTIKVTNVGHRRALLRNTFLREFQAVAGMAELYREWAASGAVFHYVSSSPWQLYGCLARLLADEGFPTGSFHLRSVRFRDPSILRLFVARRRDKRRVIQSIIRSFPGRYFVLVGDSGERDPEVYGSLARKFPAQVQRILIRRVAGRPWSTDRCERAFRGLPSGKVVVFRDVAEVRHLIAGAW